MNREAPKNILDEFCTAFCQVVERHCTYIIVSGFVAIATGRTRGTEDIDMIIEKLAKDRFCKLHEDLIRHGFVAMQSDDCAELLEYLNDHTSIRYTWKDKPLPEMEIKPMHCCPFGRSGALAEDLT
ncbi:hypothetical protein HY490_05590 [Candidatus Woesearchaeota archaeon]|nr:hypothetical protein [Candidatus Woesearchaeota archaeon]